MVNEQFFYALANTITARTQDHLSVAINTYGGTRTNAGIEYPIVAEQAELIDKLFKRENKNKEL